MELVGRHSGGREATSGRRHRRCRRTPSIQETTASPLSLPCRDPSRFSSSEIIELCDPLFECLHQQLEHVLSGLVFSPPTTAAEENGCPSSNVKVSPKGFLQLLRCCMIVLQVLLQFPEFKGLSVEKCHMLIDVLRKLCPPNSHSHLPGLKIGNNKTTAALYGANPEGGVPASFLCAILEVFIHEFLMHRQLRKHFTETDYNSSTAEKLFVPHDSHSYINTILELVTSHFLLSIHEERAFIRFMHSLSWSIKVDNEIPEVGLTAALTLLDSPFMFSAPHILQAHLILLTSRCIGVHMPTDDRKSNVAAMNHFLTAFERSVKLYEGYMSASDFVDNFIGGEDRLSCRTKELPFGSCIRSLTCDELNHQIDKLVDFCLQHSRGVLSGTKTDILNNSGAYIIENQHVIDEMIRDETCLILNYIILNVLPGETDRNILEESGEKIQQEIYCLAAVMKLMSSSLLQILWHLKRNGFSVGMKNLKGHLLCKEYDFISGIISCLGKWGASQAIQEALLCVMETNRSFKEMRLILAHFASLLSYSFRKRLEFLWRGCIFMMMAIMNLLLFEDGKLDAFRPLLSNVKESSVPQSSLANTPEVLVSRRSSVRIASNFKSIQKLYLKEQVKFLTYENRWMDSNKTEMQDGPSGNHSCNGEAFLASLPGYRKRPSQFDDLVDFIECKPGKDYTDYLSKRHKFWWWRQKRREERKKAATKGVDKDRLSKQIGREKRGAAE